MKQWVAVWVLLASCLTFGMAAPGWCNKPPEPFDLLLPEDGAVTSTTVLLDWESTTDPDGDQFSYTPESVAYKLLSGEIHTTSSFFKDSSIDGGGELDKLTVI